MTRHYFSKFGPDSFAVHFNGWREGTVYQTADGTWRATASCGRLIANPLHGRVFQTKDEAAEAVLQAKGV